jgi:murein DD-endopeptidase MepM/ murein hydrolase activator NlpD
MINANNLLQRSSSVRVTGTFTNPDIVESLQKINSNLSSAKYLIEKTNENEKKRIESERKKTETDKRKEEEKKKEGIKKQTKLLSLTAPTLSKGSFLEGIKNFLLYTILGYGALRLMKHLPKILEVSKVLIPVAETAEKMIGMLFNVVVSGIDNGYKAYDKLRALSKSIGGEDYQKTFDDFSGKLNTFVNAAVLVGLAVAGSGFFAGKGKGPGKLPSGSARRPVGAAGAPTRPNTPGVTQGSRGPNRNPLRTAPAVTQGMGDALASRAGRKAFLGTVRNVTSKIKAPVIGGLIDFALLWALGEDPGRAGFRAIGSTLLGSVGFALAGAAGLVSGPGAIAASIIGGMAGGIAGDYVGGALYDLFFGGKAASSKTVKVKGVEKRASGGVVGSKKAPSRTIRKAPKSPTKYQPKKSNPGASIGGQKEIEKLFPNPKESDIKSPGRSLTSSSAKLKKIPLLGGVMGASIDVAQGQDIDKTVFKNFSKNLGLLVDNLVNEQVAMNTSDIQRSIYAMADGGTVPSTRTLNVGRSVGEKFADAMNKTIEIASRSRVEEVLRDLRKELMLKDPAGFGGVEGASDGVGGEYGGYAPTGIQKQIYDYLINEKGMSDVQALGIMANISRESSFVVNSRQRGGPGVGLFQYSSDKRKSEFLRAVPDWEKNWKAQIDYALKEPGEPGPQYMSTQFSSAQEAADWWMRKWERPAEDIQASSGPRKHAEYLSSIPRAPNGTARFREAPGFGVGPDAKVIGGLKPSQVPLTSHQGMRWGRMHKGVDYDNGDGSPISSAQDAKVVWVGDKGDKYGNTVVLRYSNGAETRFAHLKSFNVRTGQSIKAGQLIGRQGSTGRSTASHLHFEYYPNGGAMSYRGEGDARSVADSYFRYGGNIKSIEKKESTASKPNPQPQSNTNKPQSPTSQGRVIRSVDLGMGNVLTEREGGKFTLNGNPVSADLVKSYKKNHPNKLKDFNVSSTSPSASFTPVASAKSAVEKVSSPEAAVISDSNNTIAHVFVQPMVNTISVPVPVPQNRASFGSFGSIA